MVNFVGAAPPHRVARAPDAAGRRGGLRRVQRRARLGAGDRDAAAGRQQRWVRRGPGVVRGQPRRRSPPATCRRRSSSTRGWPGGRPSLLDVGHPAQRLEPRPHRHRDDAGLRGARRQGAHRRVHRPVEAPLHARGAGLAARVPQQPRARRTSPASRSTPTPASSARWSPARSTDSGADGRSRTPSTTASRPSRSTGPTASTPSPSTCRSSCAQVFDEIDGDPAVRAVVVTGAGRGFCAGADLGGGEATFDTDNAPAEAGMERERRRSPPRRGRPRHACGSSGSPSRSSPPSTARRSAWAPP